MDEYLKYSEEIAQYLFNDMNQLQREAFEERMKTDKELATQVRRQKNMLEELHNRLKYKEVMDDPNYAEIDKQAREIQVSTDLVRKNQQTADEQEKTCHNPDNCRRIHFHCVVITCEDKLSLAGKYA